MNTSSWVFFGNRFSLEHFPKSVKRFSATKCGKTKAFSEKCEAVFGNKMRQDQSIFAKV